MSVEDGTSAGLYEFLTWAGDKGEMVEATAKAYAGAVRAVLAAHDAPETVNMRELDVPQLLDRFETRNRLKYKSGSIQTYRQRFTSAVATYLAFLDGDPDWKSAGRVTRTDGSGGTGSKPARVRKPVRRDRGQASAPAVSRSDSSAPGGGPQMVAYEMPLRPDLLVRLTLPVDMTSSDAERISSFVRSLAFTTPLHPQGEPTRDAGG